MSLESKFDLLAAAINRLADTLAKGQPVNVTAQTAPIVTTPPPAAPVSAPAPAPTQAAAPVMPPPPVFAPPTLVPSSPPPSVGPTVPFSDPKGMIDYVMGAYKALGPQKGANIQTVLTGLGFQNINDVPATHYAALFAGIEALR